MVFIAIEGGDASGKSTQARLLSSTLDAVLTREPGGCELGSIIRKILLESCLTIDPRAEALLLAASRAQHVSEIIFPSLKEGKIVVTDRFSGSFLAYQGFGRGLDIEELSWISSWASKSIEPDLNIFLDIPFEDATKRKSFGSDRFESEKSQFHHKVIQGYSILAEQDPNRWKKIDGVGTIEQVQQRVLDAYEQWKQNHK